MCNIKKQLIADINQAITSNLFDGVCLSGANISSMRNILKKKYVSKKAMGVALDKQVKYLEYIETAMHELRIKLPMILEQENENKS